MFVGIRIVLIRSVETRFQQFIRNDYLYVVFCFISFLFIFTLFFIRIFCIFLNFISSFDINRIGDKRICDKFYIWIKESETILHIDNTYSGQNHQELREEPESYVTFWNYIWKFVRELNVLFKTIVTILYINSRIINYCYHFL